MNKKIIKKDKKGKAAEYNERWETVYVDSKFNKKDLEKFLDELKKDGYKIVHVVGGEDKNK